MMVLEIVGGILVVLGGLLCVTGAVGLLRFPDVYTRLHAAGVTDTGGAGLVMAGLVVLGLVPEPGHGIGVAEIQLALKLVIILFFLWVTGTTACHALVKAAFLSGVEPWTNDEGGGPSTS